MSKPKVVLNEDDVPGAKIVYNDLNICTKVQLKRWLECRDLQRGGKKCELVQRIQNCIDNNRSHIISPAVDNGVWLVKKIQDAESNLPSQQTSISQVILPPASTKWGVFPSQPIPSGFCYGTIYSYMVSGEEELSSDENQGSGTVAGHTKPLSRGRISFTSGSVQLIQSTTHQNVSFFKSKVMASYGSVFYEVCVGLLADGNVAHATCVTCKASASNRCSHICALLFAIEDYTLHFGYDPVACTSKLKCWNQGRKKKNEPKSISDSVYKNSTGEEERVSKKRMLEFDPRPSSMVDHDFNKQDFVYNLQCLRKKTMWETILTYDYEDYAITACRSHVLKELGDIFLSNLIPSSSKFCVKEICPGQRSEQWNRERRVRITASECKSFLTKNVSSLERIINEKLWKPHGSLLSIPAVKHGVDNEDTALEHYSLMHLQQDHDLSKVGFFVNKSHPFLGCSPDGVVKKNGNIVGIVEVKCPFALHKRLLGPLEVDKLDKNSATNQCFTVVNNNQIKLKRNHSYFFQVQLQMLVMEVEWCDFIIWSRDQLAVERIIVDQTLCTSLIRTLGDVHRKYLVPEFFEMRLPRRLSLPQVE